MNRLSIVYIIAVLSFSLVARGQNDDVVIRTYPLSGHVYMLEGQGGNIGISVGDDGVFMIDSQFGRLTPKILETIHTISEKPIKFLANTHHHGDHTGGNANIANEYTTIIAHDNVRKRLVENDKIEALPVITFNDRLSIYINGEQVMVMHFENTHTDGDSMLYFTTSNVLHTGDIYFAERYPYIDLNSGGSVDGYIEAVKKALILIDDDTKIIPGHGKPSTKKDYQFFLDMLEDLKAKVSFEIKNGKLEEDVASNTAISKTYDELGYGWSFISSEKIRRTFYRSLKQ
ncbi:MBL fold metallo-hydrolase [Aestuariivivens sediminis]|uniref:MBL fold metallo-hydrolase n=1 Tax=Aestuariivivens sediminis TaxID=2913557 RepID=UPI001F55DAD0|nr:MBL fold metallo-hydrolase [Aestuariivivens sediminis]